MIQAVEEHRLPISIAARMVSAKEGEVQDLLIETLQQKVMSGRDVAKVKQLIQARRAGRKQVEDEAHEGEQQEEYIQRCKRLEHTVALLEGYIEILLADEGFKALLPREQIRVPVRSSVTLG